MPKRAVDVYWHGSRVGSYAPGAPVRLYMAGASRSIPADISRVNIPDEYGINTVSQLNLAFDRDFAEIRGITGVELE